MRGALLSIRTGFVTTEPAPRVVIDAVRDLSVSHRAGQRSGFQLSLALEKGGEIEQELLPEGFFMPGKRMIFSLVIDGVREVLMDGHVARYDVAPSNAPGGSTLNVTGTDATQLMDQIDLSGVPLPGMPPIGQVAMLLAPFATLGIVPVIVPTTMVAVENPLESWRSIQGTVYTHIQRLAGQVGYQFSLEPGVAEGQQFAYFGPDIGTLLALVVDAAGATLPPLTVNMDAASNVEGLSISFDGLSKPLIYGFYLNEDAPAPVIPIPMPEVVFSPPLGPGFIPYAKNVAMNKRTRGAGSAGEREEDGMSASDLATLMMRGMGRAAKGSKVITASGSLDVARYGALLRPRRIVNVRGAGPHSDGMYLVEGVSTSVKRGQVKQSFNLSKNAHGSFKEKVAV